MWIFTEFIYLYVDIHGIHIFICGYIHEIHIFIKDIHEIHVMFPGEWAFERCLWVTREIQRIHGGSVFYEGYACIPRESLASKPAQSRWIHGDLHEFPPILHPIPPMEHAVFMWFAGLSCEFHTFWAGLAARNPENACDYTAGNCSSGPVGGVPIGGSGRKYRDRSDSMKFIRFS